MKIQLELTVDQLFATTEILQKVLNNILLNSIENKVKYSICFDLTKKFKLKVISLEGSNSIFKKNKTAKISLKYHEANLLFNIINFVYSNYPPPGKNSNDILMLINDLHPKLL